MHCKARHHDSARKTGIAVLSVQRRGRDMSTERSDLAMCPKPSVVSQPDESRESKFRRDENISNRRDGDEQTFQHTNGFK